MIDLAEWGEPHGDKGAVDEESDERGRTDSVGAGPSAASMLRKAESRSSAKSSNVTNRVPGAANLSDVVEVERVRFLAGDEVCNR